MILFIQIQRVRKNYQILYLKAYKKGFKYYKIRKINRVQIYFYNLELKIDLDPFCTK